MIDEEFLFAIGHNSRLADGPLVYITSRGHWQENNSLNESLSADQYSMLYSMIQEIELEEIVEGIYQPKDPYITIDELEWNLIEVGFIKDQDFHMYVEETEFF